MKNKLNIGICFICLFMLNSYSFAEVSVTSVKGQAKYKTGNQWLELATGMKLEKGTKISTGVKSSVVLDIDGTTVTVRQMTMMKIEENALKTGESNTTLGLKRGGLNARISKLKTLKTSFKISTPIATSSVRGTWEEVFYGPGTGMLIKVLEGEILGENMNGLRNFLRGKLIFRQDNGKPSPDNIAGDLIDETKGGLVGNLTDEERQFIIFSSDLISTPGYGLPDIFNQPGNTNITVTPSFPIDTTPVN